MEWALVRELPLLPLPKTLIRAPPLGTQPTHFFESSQSRSPGLGNCCELFQTVEPRVHICGLPVTDPSVRALTLTVGEKNQKKTKGRVHESRVPSSDAPRFSAVCSLQPQVFFPTRRLPELNAASITGRACCAAPPEKVALSAPADATSERARGGNSQFYLTASRAELAGAVSGTEGAEVETQPAPKRNFLPEAAFLTQ